MTLRPLPTMSATSGADAAFQCSIKVIAASPATTMTATPINPQPRTFSAPRSSTDKSDMPSPLRFALLAEVTGITHAVGLAARNLG